MSFTGLCWEEESKRQRQNVKKRGQEEYKAVWYRNRYVSTIEVQPKLNSSSSREQSSVVDIFSSTPRVLRKSGPNRLWLTCTFPSRAPVRLLCDRQFICLFFRSIKEVVTMFCLAKCSMTMENCVVGYVENEGNVLRDFFFGDQNTISDRSGNRKIKKKWNKNKMISDPVSLIVGNKPKL